MTRGYRSFVLLCAAACALLAPGCTTTRMALPEGLGGRAAEMPVQGRPGAMLRDALSFGAFRVTDVRRGWTSEQAAPALGFENGSAARKFEFTLHTEDGAATWRGQAATGIRTTGAGPRERLFVCNLQSEGGKGRWQMVLTRPVGERAMSGLLTDGSRRVRIAGTARLDGSAHSMAGATGYEFYLGDRVAGAVEVIRAGSVWLHAGLNPDIRSLLAGASAAILLQRELGK